MPYIPYENRVAVDTIIDGLVKRAREMMTGGIMPGHVNYIITRIVLECLNKDSYHSLSNCVGVLRDAADEIQRRLLGPYEDTAIQKNGDMACFDKAYALRDHAILTCVEEFDNGVHKTLKEGLEAAWEERQASGKKSPYELAQERENFVLSEEAKLDPDPKLYEFECKCVNGGCGTPEGPDPRAAYDKLKEYVTAPDLMDRTVRPFTTKPNYLGFVQAAGERTLTSVADAMLTTPDTDCPGCGEPGECDGCDPADIDMAIDDIAVNCDMSSLEVVADQISDNLLERMGNRLELLKGEYFRAAKSNSQDDWYNVWGEELEALDIAVSKIHQVRDATDGRR